MNPTEPTRRSFLAGGLSGNAQWIAEIGSSCLAEMNVACQSCADICPTGAIRFRTRHGGSVPEIVSGNCSGCGDCISICPVGAISLAVNRGDRRDG
jgi:ferredoxin-type protein NapF